MWRVLVIGMLVVVGCNEHGKHPDGDACGSSVEPPVDCGVGSHCEPHCQAGVTDTCSSCFPTCVPDQPICPACTADTTCAQTCTHHCLGAVEQCVAGCVPPSSCATLTTELACQARADCVAIRHGEGCNCEQAFGCTCANPNGAFARCESIMP